MGDIKNLNGQAALEKAHEFTQDIDVCMFCTHKDGRLKSRPMSTQKSDTPGTIYFLADKSSDLVEEVGNDSVVDLQYSKGSGQFLSLNGNATASDDRAKIKELWKDVYKLWWDSADDPAIQLITVQMNDGYYWESKHGAFVGMLKMALSTVTGKMDDDGREGSLKK